jgi:hypothetical protein
MDKSLTRVTSLEAMKRAKRDAWNDIAPAELKLSGLFDLIDFR